MTANLVHNVNPKTIGSNTVYSIRLPLLNELFCYGFFLKYSCHFISNQNNTGLKRWYDKQKISYCLVGQIQNRWLLQQHRWFHHCLVELVGKRLVQDFVWDLWLIGEENQVRCRQSSWNHRSQIAPSLKPTRKTEILLRSEKKTIM